MTVYFDLSIVQDCTLNIQDTTQQFNEYLAEDSDLYVQLGRFKYTDTYTVNVIKYIPSNLEPQLLDTIITPHVHEGIPMYCDEACFSLPKDGHYVIEHLIMPSKECVDKLPNQSEYEVLYATDGDNFYKKVEGIWQPCEIVDILDSELPKTTISKASQDTFSICLLNNKYLELCKEQFCKLVKNPCLDASNAHDFELDLIWMGMNAVKYNIEFGMLLQAQSLLEELTKCTGVSKLQGSTLNKNVNHGCKCCI